MRTATLAKVNAALRDAWLLNFEDLKNQIKTWVYEEPYYNWSLEDAGTKEVKEPPLGLYTITVYEIKTAVGVVRLEPIARNYPGHGIVELYAWPTSYRVRLIQTEDGGWRVLTDSGIYLRQPWDREHFVMLIRDLIGVEDMIAVG